MGAFGFGWPADLDIRYDRSVDAEFVHLFADGGLYETVTEYARHARYPVDLQFRCEIRSNAQRAVVYVGLQKVLDVGWRQGEVRLAGHSRLGRRCGFRDEWTAWTSIADAHQHTREIEGYLELVIPRAAASAKEGAVQSAVSAFATDGTHVIDREFSVQYRGRSVRTRLLREWSEDLIGLLPDAPTLATRPVRFGDRCDVVAVSRADEVLAIEVKPRNVQSIVWAPTQAIVYSRMLTAWMREDAEATNILGKVTANRQALGLIAGQVSPIGSTARVRPVVAIQRGGTPGQVDEMHRVIEYFRESGVKEIENMLLFDVSLSGRLIEAAG